MKELRVNFGGADWHVNKTVEEFEEELNNKKEFILLPLLFDGRPDSILRVRPSQIRYYFEEL